MHAGRVPALLSVKKTITFGRSGMFINLNFSVISDNFYHICSVVQRVYR